MQGNQWIVGGGSGRGALLALNPIGVNWWVAPSGYVPYEGRGPSNNNSGKNPKNPLLTIAQAITNCVSGRGDRIILMPGTYTITAALALAKDDVSIYSYESGAAVVSGGAASLLTIDASDIVVDGVGFTCDSSVTGACIDIANTSASNRVTIRECNLLGASADAAAIGIQVGDGTNDAADALIERCMIDRFKQDIVWNGTRTRIWANRMVLASTASSTGIQVPARSSLTVRAFGDIDDNTFIGMQDAGTMLAMTFATSEAGSPLYSFRNNNLLNTGSVSANIHPEGIGVNYLGTITAVSAALVTG